MTNPKYLTVWAVTWYWRKTRSDIFIHSFKLFFFKSHYKHQSFKIYVEQSLFFVHYLLVEKQKSYMCDMHVCNLQRFERERVYIRNKSFINSMHLISVNLHDWRPSSISTPKISHVTKNGQWFRVNKKGNHTTHTWSFE